MTQIIRYFKNIIGVFQQRHCRRIGDRWCGRAHFCVSGGESLLYKCSGDDDSRDLCTDFDFFDDYEEKKQKLN